MTLTSIALLAAALWLITGTLMLATRDPLAFRQVFWGHVTIVLWPIALGVHQAAARRRAKSTLIEAATVTSSTERGRRDGISALIAAVRASGLDKNTLLLSDAHATITEQVDRAEAASAAVHARLMAEFADDPVAALGARTERQAYVTGFNAAKAIAHGTLIEAERLDAEGERAAVPLVGDLWRRLDSLRVGRNADPVDEQVPA